MIELKNLSKTYDKRVILSEINLTLPAGKTHALLGLSGSGKTTILRILLGLISSTSGEAIWNGKIITQKDRQIWAQKIGYVPQHGGLFPHLTAKENIILIAQTLKWPTSKIQERFDELYPLFSLDKATLARYPLQLSGGQKQRVSIMRAIFLNPDLILLDEPLGALDPITRAEHQTELRKIFETLKKTVIIVTHDVGEAAYFGHTVTLLDKGKIIQTGSIKDFIERPKNDFVTQFMNAQRTLHDLDPE